MAQKGRGVYTEGERIVKREQDATRLESIKRKKDKLIDSGKTRNRMKKNRVKEERRMIA